MKINTFQLINLNGVKMTIRLPMVIKMTKKENKPAPIPR